MDQQKNKPHQKHSDDYAAAIIAHFLGSCQNKKIRPASPSFEVTTHCLLLNSTGHEIDHVHI